MSVDIELFSVGDDEEGSCEWFGGKRSIGSVI